MQSCDNRINKKKKDGWFFRYGNVSRVFLGNTIFLVACGFLLFLIRAEFGVSLLLAVLLINAINYLLIQSEKYKIEEDKIRVKTAFSSKKIPLPEELLLIVTKAAAIPGIFKKVRHRRGIPWISFRDRYMVSVVCSVTLQEALDLLHTIKGKGHRYLDVFVVDLFLSHGYYEFIYSFVFEKQQFEALLKDRSCQIIVPQFLKGKISSLEEYGCSVYYDDQT
ncbi:MAG: hypothetical protein IJC84_06885 [Clostridia bacterium]|nr:hypothetical protein [Clostridia bacterium]